MFQFLLTKCPLSIVFYSRVDDQPRSFYAYPLKILTLLWGSLPELLEESRSRKLALRRGILPVRGKRHGGKAERTKESIDLMFDHLLLTRQQLRDKIRPRMQNMPVTGQKS